MKKANYASRFGLVRRDLGDRDSGIVGAQGEGGLVKVMQRVEAVAASDAPVLILGETGSGKEVIAGAVHRRSARHEKAFVRVNCGAIPPSLLDSELFGHERGSFTGATDERKGWFERADGGTLFLDEVGELPLEAQVRLLRVLQEGTYQRLGGQKERRCDVRIVAATNRDLGSMVREHRFREDLWYRLTVFPLYLPALRQRTQDIAALAWHFAERAAERFGLPTVYPSEADLESLKSYDWPGNIRELAAVIERAALLGSGNRLDVATALGLATPTANGKLTNLAPPPANASAAAAGAPQGDLPRLATLDEAIKTHIELALQRCHGRVEGPFGAAKLLAINPHTLRSRMRKLGIVWQHFRGVNAESSPSTLI